MKNVISFTLLLTAAAFILQPAANAQTPAQKKVPKKTSKVWVASGITSSHLSAATEKAGREIPPQIIRQLAQEKLITDTQHVTFRMDAKSFVVNGVKQPKDVTERYKAKYLQQPDWIINYQQQPEPSVK